jgi:hypothetical protein
MSESEVELPPELVGAWALVAGRIEGADFALGRGGASKVFDVWTITSRRVQTRFSALDVGRVERHGRLSLASRPGAGVQYLLVLRGDPATTLLGVMYVAGAERVRGLLVPSTAEVDTAPRDWLSELRSAEGEARDLLGAAAAEAPFVLEGRGERLVFEAP